MYRSLYFKIILIMVVFIIAVMCVVGTILLNSIMNYYNDEFHDQMEENLSEGRQLNLYLSDAVSDRDSRSYAELSEELEQITVPWLSKLGIDDFRTLYLLTPENTVLYCAVPRERRRIIWIMPSGSAKEMTPALPMLLIRRRRSGKSTGFSSRLSYRRF